MQKYVLGIDLGTSAVKVSAVDHVGRLAAQAIRHYPLIQPKPGYNEQNPDDWVKGTEAAIHYLMKNSQLQPESIQGLSYSGQMHGLVLLDRNYQPLRSAILWNDTRTTQQCHEIMDKMGQSFIKITHNQPLAGFTLPKIMWVQENQPKLWQRVAYICQPKDYVRLKMTDQLNVDYSDATGTIMLNMRTQQWDPKILKTFHISRSMCPPLVDSTSYVGNVSEACAKLTGLSTKAKVFAGAADNAAGAVGSGIIKPGMMSTSLGTSGVVLKYEPDKNVNYQGQLQCEDGAIPKTYYSMGVTLSAGESLRWFRNTFLKHEPMKDLDKLAMKAPVGSNRLLFTPYLVGERAPYADTRIRGSFIGVDATDNVGDFVRAVMEGVGFSFRDLANIYRKRGTHVKSVVAIGGGSRSPLWPQIEADMLNTNVYKLINEQGPGIGAAMIAAVGLGWFPDFQKCAKKFVHFGEVYRPRYNNVKIYNHLYSVYHQIYKQTALLNHQLF